LNFFRFSQWPLILIPIFTACTREPTDPPPTPPPPTPKVASIVTGQADGIRSDTSVITSTISLNDDPKPILEAGICYDTLPNPDLTKSVIMSVQTVGPIISFLAGLNSQATYYVRAYYKNASGTVYGNQVSFRSAWHPTILGNYFVNGFVQSLCTDKAGNVYAGGGFFHPGLGSDWHYLAKYDGSTWEEITGMKCANAIEALCTSPNDDIYAGTLDQTNIVEYRMMKLTGGSWSEIGLYNNLNWRFTAACTTPAGELFTIGEYAPNGYYYVSHWKDGQEEKLGNFNQPLQTICSDHAGNIYVAGLVNHGYTGDFGNTYQGNFYVSKWDGTTWTELGLFNDMISVMAVDPSGNLIVGGAFTVDLNGQIQSGSPFYNAGPKLYLAKFDGTNWSKVGDFPVAKDYFDMIQEMVIDQAGNIYVTGSFRNSKGEYYITKFDGSKWAEFATFPGVLFAMCSDYKGNIYTAGNFKKEGLGYYVAKCSPKLP